MLSIYNLLVVAICKLSFYMYFALLNQAFRDNRQITFEISRLDFEASVGPIFYSIYSILLH